MRRIALFISVTIYASAGYTQTLDIGLFSNYLEVRSGVFSVTSGFYYAMDHKDTLAIIDPSQPLYFTVIDKNLLLQDTIRVYGLFDSIYFKAGGVHSMFQLRPVSPPVDPKIYSNDLILSVKFKSIQMLNRLPLNEYLPGVIAAEAGPAAPPGYYKVQAVLSRTYALKKKGNHLEEGFHLCDAVHCQVYPGKITVPRDITEGVQLTDSLVIVDSSGELITAAFHSNSGGETLGAGELWIRPQPYLQPVTDPFWKNQPHSEWEIKIGYDDWIHYLQSKGFNIDDNDTPSRFLLKQDHRKLFYHMGEDSISLKRLREDWNLRSAFFSMQFDGTCFVFHGRGYGHGIGLSQESAMEMVRHGWGYQKVIQFFYKDVKIVNIKNLPLF